MSDEQPFNRYCSICRIGDGPLVRAVYVARAFDGSEWFECEECSRLGELDDCLPITLTPIAEWFAAHGLPVPA